MNGPAPSRLLVLWQLIPRILTTGLELPLPFSLSLLSLLSLPFPIPTYTSLTWPSSPSSCPQRTQNHDDAQQSPGWGHSEDSGPWISGRPLPEHPGGWWEGVGAPVGTSIPGGISKSLPLTFSTCSRPQGHGLWGKIGLDEKWQDVRAFCSPIQSLQQTQLMDPDYLLSPRVLLFLVSQGSHSQPMGWPCVSSPGHARPLTPSCTGRMGPPVT